MSVNEEQTINSPHASGMNASLTGDAPSVVEVRGHGVVTPGEVTTKAKTGRQETARQRDKGTAREEDGDAWGRGHFTT